MIRQDKFSRIEDKQTLDLALLSLEIFVSFSPKLESL